MSKLDVYLRSIERFGAAGATLNSGQAVTLRFPTGDRHATQVTPHDQLVVLVREVAPPNVLDQIDQNRPARFEIDSAGVHYAISVVPRPGAWSVGIEPLSTGAPSAPVGATSPPPPGPSGRGAPRAATAPVGGDGGGGGGGMEIERSQYDGSATPIAPTTSGSVLLDGLTAAARAARATDVYLSAGSPAFMRAGGALVAAGDRGAIDGELLAREIGVVAPQEARAAWAENRFATFAYGDGMGRVRVTLTRDHRGPGAALRLLPGEPPSLDQLGLPAEVKDWLSERGLIVVAGGSGVGKTTALHALVRALGEMRRTVVAIEDPIELVHVSALVSQRAVGDHVVGVAAGVAGAMREAADAIVVGAVTTAEGAAAVIDAVAGGHLVLTTLIAPGGRVAIERMLDRLPAEQRELARALCGEHLLGTITPSVGRGGIRAFAAVGARSARAS